MILHWTRCDRRKTSCATCSIATSGRKRCGTRSRSYWWHRGHPGAVAVAGHVDANTSRVVFASWHSRSSWHSTSRTSWHSSGASSRAPNSCNLPNLDLALLDTESEGVRVLVTVQCHFRDLSTALLITGPSAFRLAVVGNSEGELAGAGLLAHLDRLILEGVTTCSVQGPSHHFLLGHHHLHQHHGHAFTSIV